MEFGVVGDEMLLSECSKLVLVDLVVVIAADEGPVKPWQGLNASTHDIIKNYFTYLNHNHFQKYSSFLTPF